jgi:steroid delta-isomerase-like uncharacterized protein
MADNAAIARRWFREVWGPGGERTVDELLDRDSVGWMEGREVRGVSDFKDARRALLETFPDLTITVDDLVHEGDKVAVQWTVNATHAGDGLGIPATNRKVTFRGMTWLEIRDGRVVSGWDSWNLGGLIQTLAQPAAARSATA